LKRCIFWQDSEARFQEVLNYAVLAKSATNSNWNETLRSQCPVDRNENLLGEFKGLELKVTPTKQ